MKPPTFHEESTNAVEGPTGVVTDGACRKFSQELGRSYSNGNDAEIVSEFTAEQ